MSGFAESLKSVRTERRFSQLQLAVEADVSARHISFLETGRAQPSAEMVTRLGDAMSLPLATRNQLLLKAGFAARYPARNWTDEDMAPIRAAVHHMLSSHAPYPAFAIDRHWRVLRMNGPAEALFGALGLGEGASLIDIMFSDAAQAVIENWPEVAHHAARRLRAESAAQGGAPLLDQAAERLAAAPPPARPVGPVTPIVFQTPAARLSLFATIAEFGTPEDVTLEDVKIELYFPADDDTAAFFAAVESAGV